MEIQEQAYALHLQGLSYGEIATRLGIGKTTGYTYVREQKLLKGIAANGTVPNSSEQSFSKRSERLANDVNEADKSNPISRAKPEIPYDNMKKVSKEFSGDDLVKKKFDSLEFEGKFLELIGKPEKHFSAIIWGLPKGGKSNFAIRFADYLEEYFGRVVYIAAEEGESVTLQQKIKAIGGSKMTILETRDKDEIKIYLKAKQVDFVFIDSINVAGIDSEFLELLKNENPSKSFVSITQATKSGNFKGDQSLTHNCDFIIKVVDGVAYHEGRFGPSSEVKIFEQALYQKNKNKPIEFNWDLNRFKIKEEPKLVLKPLPAPMSKKITQHSFGTNQQRLRKIQTQHEKPSILKTILIIGAINYLKNSIK